MFAGAGEVFWELHVISWQLTDKCMNLHPNLDEKLNVSTWRSAPNAKKRLLTKEHGSCEKPSHMSVCVKLLHLQSCMIPRMSKKERRRTAAEKKIIRNEWIQCRTLLPNQMTSCRSVQRIEVTWRRWLCTHTHMQKHTLACSHRHKHAHTFILSMFFLKFLFFSSRNIRIFTD